MAIKIWKFSLFAIFVVISVGCESPTTIPGDRTISSSAGRSSPRVEIFRGLGGYMPGAKKLQERLSEHEIASKTWLGDNAASAAKQILERQSLAKDGDQSPIILLGYATGGGATKKVARILKQHGVHVDAIILIDPSFFEPVPKNVRYCYVAYRPEFWQMWNSIMRGNPVKLESAEHTKLTHVNLKTADNGEGRLRGESHITITNNDWVQDLLTKEVLRIAESADE